MVPATVCAPVVVEANETDDVVDAVTTQLPLYPAGVTPEMDTV
jgi:hypothetical protein